jgi:hypothetical protein
VPPLTMRTSCSVQVVVYTFHEASARPTVIASTMATKVNGIFFIYQFSEGFCTLSMFWLIAVAAFAIGFCWEFRKAI